MFVEGRDCTSNVTHAKYGGDRTHPPTPPHSPKTDPAHLPWAHHNIISHRSQSAFLDIRVDDVRRDGFDSAAFFPKRFQRPAAPAPPDDDDGTPEQQAAPTMEEGLRQKRTTGTRRKAPAMVPVPQSLHFRPPALLYQVINVTEVGPWVRASLSHVFARLVVVRLLGCGWDGLYERCHH